MLHNRIKFDERCDIKEHNITTLYFIAPKELLKQYLPSSNYPEAVSTEISAEFPTNHIEPDYAKICISPTKELEDGSFEDYDWHEITLSDGEIEELIALLTDNRHNHNSY